MKGKGLWALGIALVLALAISGCIRRETSTPISPSPTPRTRTPTPPKATPTPSPKPTATPTSAPLPSPPPQVDNIIVSLPVPGQQVKSPVYITGTARVFEAQVEVRVKNAAGAILGKKSVLASAGAPQWGAFATDLPFTPPSSQQKGTVEVFSISPRDGREENLVSISVILLPP